MHEDDYDLISNKKTSEEENIIQNDNSKNKKEIKEDQLINTFFEFEEEIGHGSESIVKKGVDKKYGKNYAIKKIKLKNEGERNENEYKILHKLKNRNIINYYSILEDKENQTDYIIMEYIQFGNLKNFMNKVIKKNYFSESLLCFINYHILNSLKYCHACHVCHFDLKPQNILIDEYLNIKLIDFSVSLDYNKIKSNEIELPFCGTSLFMAPEVLKRHIINVKDINKVDLFSLGIILYNLAFEEFPFGLTHEDIKKYDIIYDKINNNPLEFDNEDNFYSSYFIDFLRQLLEKDINKRINLNKALENYWVKGAQILFDEKEKLFNASLFLSYLMCDQLKNFNDYLNKN